MYIIRMYCTIFIVVVTMLSLLRNDLHLLSPSRNPDQMPKTLYPSTMLMGRADRWAGMPERINAFATSEIVVGIVSVREIYQTTERTLAKLLGSIMCDARCTQDSWLWMIIFFYCVSYCCFFRFFFFIFYCWKHGALPLLVINNNNFSSYLYMKLMTVELCLLQHTQSAMCTTWKSLFFQFLRCCCCCLYT